MTYPDIDDGRFLEPAPRAFFHDRVKLHEALQAPNRSYLAVNQRDDAAFAHEGIGVIGVIHQHPIEIGWKACFLRRRSFGNRGAAFVIGPWRGWHAVEQMPRQGMVVEALQELPIDSADGLAVKVIKARFEGALLAHLKGFLS